MMIDRGRYTSGRIALSNLSTSIDGLERDRVAGATFGNLQVLSKLLFLRGDLLGRIADHDRAESVADEAVGLAPRSPAAIYLRARIAERFHRFSEAKALLDQALASGHAKLEIDAGRAALFQAVGRYDEALVLRERIAEHDPRIDTLGSLATLLEEMDQWGAAERYYAAALDVDDGVSPLPCGQLLFQRGVLALRRGELDRADAFFAELEAVVPAHVPGRGHRAEVALARGQLDVAEALVEPLLEISDDPEYRAVYAEILAARGRRTATQIDLVAESYERLLARWPEAYADHAATFFIGIGNRPKRGLELALINFKLRDTPRSRRLHARARRAAEQAECFVGPRQ
ncbi:tetratricopeptide repeat protein [Rhizobium grahamii]|uniref:Tetratricopeptide repeat protein n=1 Tax=Rhizobium grahamii CCGE 502 TaxID=990285 RepID=S3HCD4_9HYPH|nr:tetratricopeptide repeat protein [Rhizobium grahamii]EPE96387.1 hypothetical protein RGCCGE502_21005 [Rhizobium grahamii CCGE 502]